MYSERVQEVLIKYPSWACRVQSAFNAPPLASDYSACVIEVFDQQGLLYGQAWGVLYETQRLLEQPSEFIAWCLDDQLALLFVDDEIVVNRLSLIVQSEAMQSCM
ncbi:hypothetical protein [Allocoleopsis sp.]|uniref:hypothetical protein n=1 Tax=Allocoleopsis sp. TaxID=3088169 RepID=UPI002FD3F4E8